MAELSITYLFQLMMPLPSKIFYVFSCCLKKINDFFVIFHTLLSWINIRKNFGYRFFYLPKLRIIVKANEWSKICSYTLTLHTMAATILHFRFQRTWERYQNYHIPRIQPVTINFFSSIISDFYLTVFSWKLVFEGAVLLEKEAEVSEDCNVKYLRKISSCDNRKVMEDFRRLRVSICRDDILRPGNRFDNNWLLCYFLDIFSPLLSTFLPLPSQLFRFFVFEKLFSNFCILQSCFRIF